MKDRMSSRERLLTAINHQEPDRVPICFRDVAPLEKMWNNPFERVLVLRELGVDDKLFLNAPGIEHYDAALKGTGSLYARYGTSTWPFHPDVRVKDRVDNTSDARYTILHKEIDTPKGSLSMAAKRTDDWQVETLPVVSDHLWSRSIEFLLKGPEDLEKIRYLFYDPFETDLTEFYEYEGAIKDFAARHDVLVEGDVNAASNIALNLRGAENLMCDAVENPGFVEELLDIITEWNLRRLELILDAGVDTIYHTACYETTAFWSREMYRKFFRPCLMKKLNMLHEAGVKLHYYMDLGVMPLIGDFKEMGIDILSTIDPPPQGDTDIEAIKREAGDRICLWGGVDSPQTIERGTPHDVREAVRYTVSAAAPGGGFVLSTADSVWEERAYDNVMAFIEAGLEFGKYPIQNI